MKLSSISSGRVTMIALSIFLFQSFFCSVYSQQSRQIGINPVMKVSNLRKNVENPMRLDKLSIDIKIIGQIAVTTLDMTYYNPNSRMMEGEFNFPLGDGQSVSRFALDINGTMREAVVVEKEKGRKTFEAIVRRGVDPGLLEMTAGNNFRMRVYPLPAKGTRRVILAFEQELTDKGTSDLYLLPLKISEPIAKFSVHAEVIKNSLKQDTENSELVNLSFNKLNESYVASIEKDNFVPDKNIVLEFPHVNTAERVFTAAKNNSADSSYFYINIKPQASEQVKVLPKRMTLLWDNSNSALNRNHEKELMILDNYIQKIKNLTIELALFNIKASKAETFEIVNGNWDNLKTALKAIDYDGGTSLGCLDFTKFKSDEILLFSDGMTTFGNDKPKFSQTPIYTLNSSVTANPMFLTYIAQHTGGVYIDLNKLSSSEALDKLTNSNYHFISAQIQTGQISNIYPSMPCQFDKTFSLAGILRGKSAKLVLNFGFGSTISYSKAIEITADNSADKIILSRLWAEKKIAELSLDEEKHKNEITLTGKQYGIVTPNTSLIVLENLNDYLNNDIVPPLEMQEQYFLQKNKVKNEVEQSRKNAIGAVILLSNKQTRWWNTIFPKQVKNYSAKFGTPVLARDEVVTDADELKSQEELTNANVAISVADVRGAQDNIRTVDIADVKAAVTEVADVRQGYVAGLDVVKDNNSSIQLNAWDPQTPYLKVLQYAVVGSEYASYLKLKKEYGAIPSFYIDVADYFSKLGKKDTAVTILSNVAELSIESPQLLRVLGYKLLEFKRYAEAVMIFEKVLELKGEEPQSYRDLGLAYEANGKYQKAIKTLYEVLKKDWDSRFPEIGIIVMNEINSIITAHPELNCTFIDKRLIKKEPVNIRVILTWDTDNCDMDLWVTDPKGEKCYFQNTLTRLGGKISHDFTNGYGPEEFMIKKAMSGKYLVQANYYGTHSQAQLAPVNLHMVFITNFGKPNQKKQELTIRLENKKDIIEVGSFSFENN
jgi:tetratricopeptide (TPR) repeat protein